MPVIPELEGSGAAENWSRCRSVKVGEADGQTDFELHEQKNLQVVEGACGDP